MRSFSSGVIVCCDFVLQPSFPFAQSVMSDKPTVHKLFPNFLIMAKYDCPDSTKAEAVLDGLCAASFRSFAQPFSTSFVYWSEEEAQQIIRALEKTMRHAEWRVSSAAKRVHDKWRGRLLLQPPPTEDKLEIACGEGALMISNEDEMEFADKDEMDEPPPKKQKISHKAKLIEIAYRREGALMTHNKDEMEYADKEKAVTESDSESCF